MNAIATHRSGRLAVCSLALLAFGVGCSKDISMEDMKAMKPQRPPELDRLNMLAGKWSGTGTGEMMGMKEPIQVSGTTTTDWQADGWYLVERGEYKMGDMEPMKMIGVWTYDARAKKYRAWFFDSMGSTGTGTAKYNEATNTWTMRAKGSGPMGKTRGKGTMCATGDTITWNWKEYPSWDVFGLMKIMEMNGTNKKQ